MQDLLPAILPRDRLAEPWWAARHAAVLEKIRSQPDVRLLLIGDSMTQNYEKSSPPDENFAPIWQQFYAPRGALNLGFSGDSTANLLWRLTHGELDRLRPQAAVVLIGTNNTGHEHQSAEQTIAGLRNVIGTLTQRLPQTRILVLGLLPSDVSAEKSAADKAVNAWLLAHYGTADSVLKAGASVSTQAVTRDGTLSTEAGAHNNPSAAEAGQPRGGEACVASTESSGAAKAATHCSLPAQAKSENSNERRDPRVTYLDLTAIFQKPDGTLNTAIFYDPRLPAPGKALHPDSVGQRKMAEAIEPTLSTLMYDKPRTATALK